LQYEPTRFLKDKTMLSTRSRGSFKHNECIKGSKAEPQSQGAAVIATFEKRVKSDKASVYHIHKRTVREAR